MPNGAGDASTQSASGLPTGEALTRGATATPTAPVEKRAPQPLKHLMNWSTPKLKAWLELSGVMGGRSRWPVSSGPTGFRC